MFEEHTVKPEDLLSSKYRALLQERYTRAGWGGGGYHHVDVVAEFAMQTLSTSILDYGCGRGTLAQALAVRLRDRGTPFAAHDIREYDPGILGKDSLPTPADLVVATDVLEHIEPDKVDVTLKFIRSLAKQGAFFIIATVPAREILGDGSNAHRTIQPDDWWLDKISSAGFTQGRFERRKGLWVWCQ